VPAYDQVPSFLVFHQKESEVDERLFLSLSELGVTSTLSQGHGAFFRLQGIHQKFMTWADT
jgi:hypothetical protein